MEPALEEDHASHPEELLMVAEEELNQLILGIQLAFANFETDTPSGESLSTEVLIVQLGALAELLEQYDTSAEEALDQVLSHVSDPDLREPLKVLKKQISAYDFEGATQGLADIMKTLGA